MPVNLPRLLIGILIAAYWARVIHLARKTRRKADHSANIIPPTKWGRITRAIWFPVVILWILIPLSSAFPLPRYSSSPLPRYSAGGPGRVWNLEDALALTINPLFDSPSLQIAALAVALFAFILTWICWQKMGKSWRMGIDPNEKNQLITTGPYSRIRHPIYALSSLLMLATALALPSPLLFLVAAIHLTLLQLESRREEKYLINAHGQNYVQYHHRTGRFLPRLGVKGTGPFNKGSRP